MIKTDAWIKRQIIEKDMIVNHQAPSEGIISRGISSMGYDITCGRDFKVFCRFARRRIIDPKNFDENCYFKINNIDYLMLPPHGFALGVSVETFHIPRNVLGVCLGKSTYARCGIIVNVTPLEPEWSGQVTLEFSNTTAFPAKIYAGEGVAQVIFLEADKSPLVTYADKNGKYQNQKGVVGPR